MTGRPAGVGRYVLEVAAADMRGVTTDGLTCAGLRSVSLVSGLALGSARSRVVIQHEGGSPELVRERDGVVVRWQPGAVAPVPRPTGALAMGEGSVPADRFAVDCREGSDGGRELTLSAPGGVRIDGRAIGATRYVLEVTSPDLTELEGNTEECAALL